MKIGRLDHVNVRTSRVDEMVLWYETYLGFKKGWRPAFGFDGAWLYAGDHPMVHLVHVDNECRSVEPKIEHFAFTATGYSGFLEKLRSDGIEADIVHVPGLPIVQVNVKDCDGNHVHIDFPADEL